VHDSQLFEGLLVEEMLAGNHFPIIDPILQLQPIEEYRSLISKKKEDSIRYTFKLAGGHSPLDNVLELTDGIQMLFTVPDMVKGVLSCIKAISFT